MLRLLRIPTATSPEPPPPTTHTGSGALTLPLVTASGGGARLVEARKWAPGHWITVGNSSGRRGTYYKQTGGATTDLLRLTGVRGIQLRYDWKDLEPTPNTFDFGPVKSSYADTERSIRADLWRCAQAGSLLIAFIEDKSFDGAHITPTDLRGAAYEQAWVNGNNTGYCAARWNSTIVSRWGALIEALGAAFDSDPNFHGIAFPETATSLSSTALTASSYSATDYRDAMIAQLQTASDAFPTSRVFWYHNFMPSIAQDAHLDTVVNTIKVYNGGNHGVLMGGPDILPDPVERTPGVYSDAVTDRCEPRYRAQYGEIELFCSMQNDSYRHIHRTDLTDGATTPADPRMPGYFWTVGSTWTTDDMFVFARDYLRLDYIIWNFLVASSGQEWEPDGRLTVAANPTFNL
jgi:hypothetical protein